MLYSSAYRLTLQKSAAAHAGPFALYDDLVLVNYLNCFIELLWEMQVSVIVTGVTSVVVNYGLCRSWHILLTLDSFSMSQ